MRFTPSRRALLKSSLSAGLGLTAANIVRADEVRPRTRGKMFRVAHLTDMHLDPEPASLRAGQGYTAALKSLEKLNPKPDVIITGGDHVMDSLYRFHDDAAHLWNFYHSVLKDNSDLPIHPVIGNHDALGWCVPEKVPPTTPGYGKQLYLERMKLDRAYYSFDAGGWHFIVLDNITHRDNNYVAELGQEQTAWLKSDLAKTPKTTPICVTSHVPLLSACALFDDDVWKGTAYTVPDTYMHRDVKPLLLLLRSHGNVKLCLSGHIHLVDRVDYLGMAFICNGAVCGNWWKGPRYEFPEGYGVIDFYPDGTFDHQYATFGWVAAPAAGK